jgi:hypothetical protein
VALASIVASAAAAVAAEPFDLEGVLGPRVLGPAPAAPDPDATKGASAPLHLVWMDPAGTAIGVEAQAREEARSLLERMGVAVAWRAAAADELTATGEVRVILLDRAAQRGQGTPVLGATPPRFEVAPFVWVHVPNVRSVIGLRPGGPATAVDAQARRSFAIALGRVVAHEVVHALAPAVKHGTGLMSASFSRTDLTGSRIDVAPDVALAVRAALRGGPAVPRLDTGVVAAATAGEAPLR